MSTVEFNTYKSGLIKKISAAISMQEIQQAFMELPIPEAQNIPCSWTTEELKERLSKSEADFQQGRYLTAHEAISHFKRWNYGSKMV